MAINGPWHTECSNLTESRDEHNIFIIMKKTCPSGYHHNGFVANHASCTSCAQLYELPQSHCRDNQEGTYIYIYLYIYICILFTFTSAFTSDVAMKCQLR